MLEKRIEREVCDYAKSLGILVYKFSSPSHVSVPDRLFILSNGNCFFIEFKALGKKPTRRQHLEHEKLRGHDVPVYVIDNVHDGKKTIDLLHGGTP